MLFARQYAFDAVQGLEESCDVLIVRSLGGCETGLVPFLSIAATCQSTSLERPRTKQNKATPACDGQKK